jgi:ferredoxin
MSLLKITIDQREMPVAGGSTILEAARALKIPIPTLCFAPGSDRFTSCMLCVVHELNTDRLLPACSAPVEDGMRIVTDDQRVEKARRRALEFLLSEHVGDCEAPCQRACPAHMDIPTMIRCIQAGELSLAAAVVKNSIVLPATLGRICPAPCEKACKRGFVEDPVAICLLKRYVADTDLAQDFPFHPAEKPASGRTVAVVGAGPTGLAAAYYLARAGHGVHVFDRHPHPGGMLRYGVPDEDLPKSVLDAEIERIIALGVEFHPQQALGRDMSPEDLRHRYAAVILAVGALGPETYEGGEFPRTDRGLAVDRRTYATGVPGFFAGGNAVSPARMAIRSLAHGREAAAAVDQFLSGAPLTGSVRRFNSITGKLLEGEAEEFLKEAESYGRIAPLGGLGTGYTREEAGDESRRCLGCDCRKRETCRLRGLAEDCRAVSLKFPGGRRRGVQKILQHAEVIYQPGKCIRCGLCIQITRKSGEALGLTFVGRGFDVRVDAPFHETLNRALTIAAADCVAACPTAALAWKDRSRS